jgi:putative transposase
MPRVARSAPPGYIYHVLNRSVGKMHMFRRDADYDAFQRIMLDAYQRHPIRILSYCVLASHWHFVVWPRKDGQLTDFFRWLTHTHAMRWRVSHHTVGYGHLYQGRFKSFPIQRDDHLLTACRYVERNPLTAGLVSRIEEWRWSSLWVRLRGDEKLRSILADPPLPFPADWIERVNRPLTRKELDRFEASLKRGRPFGNERWTSQTAARLGLQHTIRPEGRPRKKPKEEKD